MNEKLIIEACETVIVLAKQISMRACYEDYERMKDSTFALRILVVKLCGYLNSECEKACGINGRSLHEDIERLIKRKVDSKSSEDKS